MANFTPTQGRYLAYIHAYTSLHGQPPAESELAAAMCVSPPSAHLMVKTLEKKGLVLRQPGQPRSVRILVPEEEIPPWNNRKQTASPAQPGTKRTRAIVPRPSPPANLYVLLVWLMDGPFRGKKFANKAASRVIEIRGDQTLEQLHEAIFKAYDRWDEHCYEFQFGKRPHDPAGPKYGMPDIDVDEENYGDATATKLDELGLKKDRCFGYWFDFGDDWFHQIEVERIEQAIPTVTYPRITKRIGKSPPQFAAEEW